MKFFGTRYDFPVYAAIDEALTPVNQPCVYCGERIEQGDDGFALPFISSETEPVSEVYYHRHCLLESLGIRAFKPTYGAS